MKNPSTKTNEELIKENFRRFLDDSPLGARIVSAAGETIYANRARLDIYGYEGIVELQNTSTKERYTPESYAEFLVRREKRQRGEFVPSDYEISILRKDGNVRRLQVFRKEILWNGKPQFQTLLNDITDRKRAEEERKAHIRFLESLERVDQAIRQETDVEQMLRNIVQTAFSIFDCDRTWLLYPCDPDAPSFRVPVEITRPEYPGAKILNMDVPMSPGEARNMREALESDEPVTYTAGTERPVSTAKQFGVQSQMFMPVYPKLGKPWVFGMHQCSYPRIWTTEEKKLFKEIGRRMSDGLSTVLFLRELQEREERYRKVFENHAAVKLLIDPDTGSIIKANEAAVNYYGWSHEQLRQMKIQEINTLPPEDVKKEMEKARTQKRIHFEFRHRRADGSIRDVEVFSSKIEVKGKDILHSIIHDITDRKRAEEALSNSEGRLHALVQTIPDLIWLKDKDGVYLSCNPMFERFFGAREADIVGKTDYDFVDRELADFFREHDRKAMAAGKPTRNEEWITFADDGHRALLDTIKTPMYDARGTLIGVLGIGRDITERKRAEDMLRIGEERYRMAEAIGHVGNWEYNLQTTKFWGSDEAKRIYGFDPEALDFSTDEVENCIPERERVHQALVDLIEAGKPYNLEFEIHPKNSLKPRIISSVAALKRDEDGNPLLVTGLIQDITERKRAEEKLQQTLENLRKALIASIQLMVSAVEARDPYTAGHQIRSTNLARAIATEMALPREKIEGLRMAGSIHDIGKLSIPAEILSKPTKLTNIEFSLIKEHARQGYEMLKAVESPWSLAEILYQHHERMDGSGYPRNLKGDEILMEARIMAVADVVEAMASHRPYRPALGIEAALEEIEKNKGTIYDNTVADACLKLFREKGFQFEEV